MAVTLVNTANVPDNGTFELGNTSVIFGEFNAVTTAVVGGTTYIFGTGFTDDGVSVFSLTADGTVNNAANVPDTELVADELFLNGAVSVATALIGATTFLFVAGAVDDGISVFSVANDGVLTSVDNQGDTEGSGELFLDGVASLATISIGGATFLYAVGADDGGLSVFSVSGGGILTSVQNIPGLDQPRGVATTLINGAGFLFITDVDTDTVFSTSINPVTGAIVSVDAEIDNGTLQLDGAFAVTSAAVGSKTFAFVGGSFESSLGGISVFEVSAVGELTNVFNQPDNASLLLGAVDALATAKIAGTTYLFAASRGELGVSQGAISVFGVAADGTLVHFTDVTDDDTLQLNRASSISTVVVGNDTFVIAASQGSGGGFSVFRVDVTGLTINGTAGSDVIDALNSAPGQLLPSELGDQIFGFAGNDTIDGLDGADTLTGGSGKDFMTGGDGADTFDFNLKSESVKGANRDVIQDFAHLVDDIDLSDIDAKAGVRGNQKFKFIGAKQFHKVKGELQAKYNAAADVAIVSGDTNGDGKADFQIEVHSAAPLSQADFVL